MSYTHPTPNPGVASSSSSSQSRSSGSATRAIDVKCVLPYDAYAGDPAAGLPPAARSPGLRPLSVGRIRVYPRTPPDTRIVDSGSKTQVGCPPGHTPKKGADRGIPQSNSSHVRELDQPGRPAGRLGGTPGRTRLSDSHRRRPSSEAAALSQGAHAGIVLDSLRLDLAAGADNPPANVHRSLTVCP